MLQVLTIFKPFLKHEKNFNIDLNKKKIKEMLPVKLSRNHITKPNSLLQT